MSLNVKPREFVLTKEDGKGYGFSLRVEKDVTGHLVRSIESGGVADKAGLKDGDRVLKVNQVFVDDIEHPEVVKLIVDSGKYMTISVLDEASYVNAKKNGVDLSGKKSPSDEPVSPKPRLCYLVKDKSSFGFSLKAQKGNRGIFLDTTPDGAASKAGIQQGDRIIEVNGKNVESNSYEETVKLVRESGDTAMFLVVDKETDDHFQKIKKKITADQASVRLLPSPPKIVELSKAPDGYGFYLRQEKNRKGHFIVEIDPKSPAEKANLKDYDRIVAVNGESVEQMQHEDVVETIRKGGNKTTLLISDKVTDELYAKAGLSPFIYLKQSETSPSVKEETTKPTEKPSSKPTPVPAVTVTPKAPTSSPDPKHKPRLCKIKKGSSGFGFNLNAIKDVPGQYLKQVTKGGPADVAGIKEEDVLVEVNGINVMEESYDDVVMRIKQAGTDITLLVVSQEAFEHFKAQNIKIKASMADPLPEANSAPKKSVETAPSKAKSDPPPETNSAPKKSVETAPSKAKSDPPTETNSAPKNSVETAPSKAKSDPPTETNSAPKNSVETAPSKAKSDPPTETNSAPKNSVETAPSKAKSEPPPETNSTPKNSDETPPSKAKSDPPPETNSTPKNSEETPPSKAKSVPEKIELENKASKEQPPNNQDDDDTNL
ncbi:Na(+)/H(+) exchange regulatory cofactor NHE-RF3 [Mixophyes fleayi]|uniref:Na(+)/H(+) exchange regulatory cofactor NHE-RF3 n=1 Tax=Mixophyes fleayi TaxID=3061075 RepID=UPI003F4E3C5E